VTLSRDEHGVVHVDAADDEGLYWGMGYAHALDRGMQMLLMRIIGQGRTAECLRDSEETVEVDRFFRRMNWGGNMDAQVEALDEETRRVCVAYCEGVNDRLGQRSPWEFKLTGYRPPPWIPADSILLSRMAGYLTLAQSQAEVERLFVEILHTTLEDRLIEALFPAGTDCADRNLLTRVRLAERVVPKALNWACPPPILMASNNWVVSGAKTASGAAMMANDPHLEVNRLPNVWYETVLRTKEVFFAGMSMPGIPAALIGRSNTLAWGATYTFMDAVDSWVEHCRDECCRRGENEWRPLRVRRETIKRKKHEPVEVTFYENEHGVVDGDAGREGYYLATRWAPAESGAASLRAGRRMLEAVNVEQGMAAIAELETAFNWVLADTDGNIGYQMSGLMPKRAPGWSGFAPRPGWDSCWDWQGFVPAAELPSRLNPEEGFIVTANQDLNHLGSADPINMPMGDYRARRIAELLSSRDDHDVESFRRIQLDTYSLQARAFLDVLEPLLPDGPAAQVLRDWDGRYDTDSVGASLFEDFYAELRLEVFGESGFGAKVLKHLVSDTGVFIDFYQLFDRVLLDEGNAWYGRKSQSECFAAAFERAAARPREPWGKRNQVLMKNIFFDAKLPKRLGFDAGPLPLPGGRATPRQGQIYRSAGRMTSFAPSVRLIADLSEDVLHTNMAGGPSDRRLSKWYTSGLADWQEGRLKTLKA